MLLMGAERMDEIKYQLHSSGENWFHFRKDLNSMMESFSVTYCHDGTVCMTGDYGCLSWRREWFSGRIDYGFPGKLSGIGYFAGKVVRAEENQKIKTWKRELAVKEIDEAIANKDGEWSDAHVQAFKNVSDRMNYFEDGEYGHIQMMEAFNDDKSGIELEYFADLGVDYTDSFKFKYELLTSVSDMILQAVAMRNSAVCAHPCSCKPRQEDDVQGVT
jgi:hypothetical protein